MSRSLVILGMVSLSILSTAMMGCSQKTGAAKMSDMDKKNFQGGPMPPEARAEMMKRMQAANAPPPQTNK